MNISKTKNINFLKPETYQIKWLCNFLETSKGNMSIEICSKQKKTAFLTTANDNLKPLIIQDVIINESGICEDSKFCLNVDCEYNFNSHDDFAAAMNMPRNEIDFNALVKRCKEIDDLLLPEFIDFDMYCISIFEKPYLAWK